MSLDDQITKVFVVIEDYGTGPEAREAIRQLCIERLEALLERADMAWVERPPVRSHEQFVHVNLIKDVIKALKGEQK